MPLIENHPNRAVLGYYDAISCLEAIIKYAQVVESAQPIPKAIKRMRKEIKNNYQTSSTTISLPEQERPTRIYGMDFRINPSARTCEFFYHSSTSAEIDLLARTAEFIETLILKPS